MMVRAKGRDLPWREGMTVADLLKALGDPYPYAVVRVNETTVSRPDFAVAVIPDNAEVFPIPMIAGG